MKAFAKALPLIITDVAATVLAYTLAAYGTQQYIFLVESGVLHWYLFGLAAIDVAALALTHMYSSLWRYASLDETLRLVASTLLAAVAGQLVCGLCFGVFLPVRAVVCAWALSLVVSSAARFTVRANLGVRIHTLAKGINGEKLPKSLIVGAGETGGLVVRRMLAGNQEMQGFPVALVDDDTSKVGSYVHGIRVAGSCDKIPSLCRDMGIDQIVIAIPTAKKSEVEISDLLSRDEKKLDCGKLGYVSGKCVLVTGGGGSIGSEIVRQLLAAKPSRIVVFDIYENTAYELFHELKGRAHEAGTELSVVIGSITNIPVLESCFDTYKPDVVFHAAAHKHVPLMEENPREAIENNVFGTLNLVRLTHQRKCTHFVLISTDKAVNPTNVMGATKRMDEMIVQYYAAHSETVFTAVRFGNVLGSHGSVIPLFKRQLREGGPITVTHRDITRYFMTIPEASRLVITAGALAKGGEIFVLNMGEPVKIYDLALDLIRLSGLQVGTDIEIVETGLRPGEKMYEELLMDSESLLPTEHKDIRVSVGDLLDCESFESKLAALQGCLEKDNDSIKATLAEVVPTYHPQYK